MQTPAARLSFQKQDREAWIRISGRATLQISGTFKALVRALLEQGCRRFRIDLSECPGMDSTFVGILTRLAIDSREPSAPEPRAESIELVYANPHITHLLDTLGLVEFFAIVEDLESPAPERYTPFEPEASATTQSGLTRTLYEAHKTLSDLSPSNKEKFESVLECVKEELAEQEAETRRTSPSPDKPDAKP